LTGYRLLLRERRVMSYSAIDAFLMAGLFAYIAGSPAASIGYNRVPAKSLRPVVRSASWASWRRTPSMPGWSGDWARTDVSALALPALPLPRLRWSATL
jgi:hypothetical protein